MEKYTSGILAVCHPLQQTLSMKTRVFLLCAVSAWAMVSLASAQTAPARPGQGQKDAAPSAPPSKQRGDEGRSAPPVPAAPPAQDAPKRSSRMSPEERKELRQQIHEAGHDLYPRKRTAP